MNEFAGSGALGIPNVLLGFICAGVFFMLFALVLVRRKKAGLGTGIWEDPTDTGTEPRRNRPWKLSVGLGVAAYVVTVIVRMVMGKGSTDVWLWPAAGFLVFGLIIPVQNIFFIWSRDKGFQVRERRR